MLFRSVSQSRYVEALDSFKLGVVTEFVAINGDVKYPYCERMNMSTSPGLPYKKMKLRNTKYSTAKFRNILK